MGNTSVRGDIKENTKLILKKNPTRLDYTDYPLYSHDVKFIEEILKKNTLITQVCLSGNSISKNIQEEGAKNISEILLNNTSLTELDFGDNPIKNQGIKHISEALKVNSTLTILKLKGTNIDEDGAISLSEALEKNTSLIALNLSKNTLRAGGVNKIIENISENIRRLSFADNDLLNDGVKIIAKFLIENSTLQNLNLSANKIESEGIIELLKALQKNSTLTKLNLKDNTIGDEASYIAETLKLNSTLRIINLSNCELYYDGALLISEAICNHPSLEEINLSDNKLLTKELKSILNNLKSNRTLRTLHLAGNNINQMQDISDYIGNNNIITSLNLSRNKIDNSELRSLITNLSGNSILEKLDLSFNEIDGDGLASLGEALLKNTSLQNLNLSGNNFSKGIQSLSIEFSVQLKNTTLTKLSLSSTKLNQAKNLSESFKNLLNSFPGLTELDLSRNYLGNEQIKEITEVLSAWRKNSELKIINLKGNKINQSGAKYILSFLKSNTSITDFDLSENYLKLKMIKKIEDILEKNRKRTLNDPSLYKIQDLTGISKRTNSPSISSPTPRSSLSGSRTLFSINII